MKKHTFIKSLAMALTCALAITAFTPAITPVNAQAATKKVKGYKTYQKAKAVKLGSSIVTVNNNARDGYVKFKAPSAGKYTFTFHDIKSKGKQENATGVIHLQTLSGTKLKSRKVKTLGGKSDTIYLATKYNYENYTMGKEIISYSFLYERSATITLKKNQTIYLHSFFFGDKQKYTYHVNIQKNE